MLKLQIRLPLFFKVTQIGDDRVNVKYYLISTLIRSISDVMGDLGAWAVRKKNHEAIICSNSQ